MALPAVGHSDEERHCWWVVKKKVAKPSSKLTTHFFLVTGHSSWPFLSLRQASPSLTGRVQ